jgi:hypothetical protein
MSRGWIYHSAKFGVFTIGLTIRRFWALSPHCSGWHRRAQVCYGRADKGVIRLTKLDARLVFGGVGNVPGIEASSRIGCEGKFRAGRLYFGGIPMMSTGMKCGARTAAAKRLSVLRNGIAVVALGVVLGSCSSLDFGFNDYDAAGGITKQEYGDLLSRRAPEKQVDERAEAPADSRIPIGAGRAGSTLRF